MKKTNNIIVPNAVKRNPDYIYYIDGDGNICQVKRKTKKEKWGMWSKTHFDKKGNIDYEKIARWRND